MPWMVLLRRCITSVSPPSVAPTAHTSMSSATKRSGIPARNVGNLTTIVIAGVVYIQSHYYCNENPLLEDQTSGPTAHDSAVLFHPPFAQPPALGHGLYFHIRSPHGCDWRCALAVSTIESQALSLVASLRARIPRTKSEGRRAARRSHCSSLKLQIPCHSLLLSFIYGCQCFCIGSSFESMRPRRGSGNPSPP